MYKYQITIQTSDVHKDAGSDGDVYIQLIGEGNEATPWNLLDNIFNDDFERGQKDVFDVETNDVGVPFFIRFEIRGREEDKCWACDDVIVTYRGADTTFPVYDWVEEDVTIARGSASSFTKATSILRSVRSKEIERARAKFQWLTRPSVGHLGQGLPRFADFQSYSELPKMFKMTEERENSMTEATVESAINLAVASAGRIFSGFNDLDDFKELYLRIPGSQHPPFIDRWHTDVEFGRQQIMGFAPLSLKRCWSLPDCCDIDDNVLSNLLDGKSLHEELQAGYIYIGDFSDVFKGITRNTNLKGETLHCPEAIGLFRVNTNQDLVPIAIQLVPYDADSVFTPESEPHDWLLAKMYYRTALSNMHEWHYHFLLTHNVMEAFSVSLFRCIPRSHPLYKLLRPHLQTVSSINAKAREGLVGEGTTANKTLATLGIDVVRSMYKTFNMKDLVLPDVLYERGLDDRKTLPKNYFRDDALKLWNIIKQFVTSILRIYYTCDDDVSHDDELQAFARDVAMEGLGWEDGNTRGMESEIKDLQQLISLCTTLIFTSSASHAAVNFPQYQTYQFIPNSPVAMRLPPHRKGEATLKRIMDSLPDLQMAVSQIAITYTLSQYASDEVYLGEYPMNLFSDPSALAAIRRYRSHLLRYSQEIKERNMVAGDDAYDWLLPSKVPNSIAV